MSAGTRLLAPLEAVPARSASARYVCSTCRRQFVPRYPLQPLTAYQSRRHNSSDSKSLPFTEKVRRKIWGTDNPPGLEDPYGGESFLEKRLREKREAKAGTRPDSDLVPEVIPEEHELSSEAPIPTPTEEYVPAMTWDGLEHVGTSGSWRESPPSSADLGTSFIPETKVLTRDEILTALHQTAVELCIMKGLNKPLQDICNVLMHEDMILALINRVEIKPSSQIGIDALIFPSDVSKEALLEFFRDFDMEQGDKVSEVVEESDATADPAAATDAPSAAPSRLADLEVTDTEIRTPKQLEFLFLPLDDPEIRFAFLKRASQLTGYRIPDPELRSMTRVSRLCDFLTAATKPEPEKLADILIAEGKYASLPNVKIFDRRQTPIDHEKEIGRWKIITQELTKRQLPVTGRAKN
ncbi:hypothetical protein LOZ57_001345 [Ophidiomyces ophidiicola]|uniref:uncharacterized protein n=1 Tax=Ophidiomyces ophidiicola TaxID=1387563 RepID=UPI0020C56C7A|nr:uncharacterized protein LOZ57_001345 [Ophidiomyces ophidiicola]KAI1951932.1 hypothetical protein LOZ57_001345 [Ophidiomyces ophidiicola]KAI2047015.1 hypothetical protein LOZ43_005745 [Ophidiomyces ophidiicola]